MDFWNHKINVSKEAAQLQVDIIGTFPPEKRFRIALDFANAGVDGTRDWIKKNNPGFSELEVTLEFVRLMSYETGDISEEHWRFFKKTMEQRIKKDWSRRFRKMMEERNWTYEDVAKMGGFKNGKSIEATVSRGLPSFAKLSVLVHEQGSKA